MQSANSAIDRMLSAREHLAQTKQHFWSTFDQQTLKSFPKMFARISGENKRILEVGSGYGFGCLLFALMGAKEVHGFDIVKSAVESAEEVKQQVDATLPVYFKHHDAVRGLPYADSSFDAVLMIEVMSHVLIRDMRDSLVEVVRVLDRGGIFYLSDGNNARSPWRRHVNYQIWQRFERGPKTAPGETIHTHQIKAPYIESRKRLAWEAVPSLTEQEAQKIAELTFRYVGSEVRAAAQRYARTRELPNSPFIFKQCPIDPIDEMYIEQLIDPMEVRRILRELGCEIVTLSPRRKLPFAKLLEAVPALMMLISNGFLLIAQKK
jgi:SAM-dependent methyltransferase